MRWGVVRFPGSLDDGDALYALRDVMGQDAAMLWHKDEALGGAQCVVLPGGFSYGDYLRCGAIARFSPIMKSVARFAADGGLVLGICNGFQILCEAHLLPGALMRNRSLSFICDFVNVRVENAQTPFTRAARAGEILHLPIKHGEGCYVAPVAELAQMEERGQVVLRYVDAAGVESEAANPNKNECRRARRKVGCVAAAKSGRGTMKLRSGNSENIQENSWLKGGKASG
jgi:phosphoribosylformylglycinamidine synthase